MIGQNISCIFCGNPRPNVLRELQDGTQTRFSLKGSLRGLISSLSGAVSRNRQRFRIITPTPLIDCLLCNRRYYLFAVKSDKMFVDYFLNNHVFFTNNVIDTIKAFGLPLNDLTDHIIGIAQPEDSRNLIYIVVKYQNTRYFISCEKQRGKYLALNAEKVVIQ